MAKLVITLEDEDLVDLQGVLLGEDEKAALDFLQTRIAPKVPSKGTRNCDSSRRNPYLMRDE